MSAWLAPLLLCAALGVRGAEPSVIAFSAAEKARILSHGPWPLQPRRDAANQVSGMREAIAFGERLFFEPQLSGTGSVLCASCHAPFRAFQDARPRGLGLEEVERNTPTLLNVGFYRRFGWDGSRESLASQSIRPLLEPREMRSSAAHVAALVRKRFAPDYASAFGAPPPANDESVLADVGKALAAYQETLITGRTPFDDFRDALERGAAAAMASYPAAARRGLQIFAGKGACDTCHSGPLFSGGATVEGVRVPALRNVALTAPYMHDGRVATLAHAVRHHSQAQLTASESEDLLVFLQSLTETSQLK
jgi:cytochrome c peroxidase